MTGINKYFNNYGTAAKPEQRVIENLIVESIKIMGFDAYYLPNSNDSARDLLYGEDPVKKFEDAFPLEMYISSDPTDYIGQRDIFTKFGLEIKDDLNVICSRRSFQQRVPQNTFTRPREGDLVYVPVTNGVGELFEIKFVEHNKDFNMLGKKYPYFYELVLEKYKYSQEIIQTGVADIDIVVSDSGYTTHLNLDGRLFQIYNPINWSAAVYNNGYLNINTTDSTLIPILQSLQVGDSFSYVMNNTTYIQQPVTQVIISGSLYQIKTGNTTSGTVTTFSAPLSGSNGVDYNVGELVYQSPDIAQANATALGFVQSWVQSTGVLSLNNIAGEFIDGQFVYGSSSNAQYTLVSFNALNSPAKKEKYDNEYISNSANSILDLSESNPFGSI
jgi:hypothetical protein